MRTITLQLHQQALVTRPATSYSAWLIGTLLPLFLMGQFAFLCCRVGWRFGKRLGPRGRGSVRA
jgi:hypothetical protein